MYYHIDGILAYKEPSAAVIDCGGVGYKLTISAVTAQALPKIGERVKLLTHLLVREDSMELLGFADTEEKSAFVMLISVSGVGPKVAMSVLSILGSERFAYAVASGNYKDIAKAHGVSAKTAQKIIIELKDKIARNNTGGAPLTLSGSNTEKNPGLLVSNNRTSATDALIVLGYTRQSADEALDGMDIEIPLDIMIKQALKKLIKT